MWEKKSDAGGLHDKDNTYRWSGDGSQETIWDWLGDINAEGGSGYAGHDDWRIPNVRELQSIVDYSISYPGPMIALIFGPTAMSDYWSSTSHAGNATGAWNVNFDDGTLYAPPKDTLLPVRAVRGGQP